MFSANPYMIKFISSTNCGRPCQMRFCNLSMPFQALSSSVSCSFLIPFYQLIIRPVSPRFSSAPLLFLWQQSLTFQIVKQFINMYTSEYLPHSKHVIGLNLVTSFPFFLSFIVSTVLPVVSQSGV